MKRILQISIALLALAILISACSFAIGSAPTAAPTIIFVPVTVTPAATETPRPTDTPLPTIVPTDTAIPATNTPELLHFYVSGLVWQDQCSYVDGPTPSPLLKGCIPDPFSNGISADGIYQSGEPGIAGVTIQLVIDCNYGAFTTTTDASGHYSMSFTVPKSAGIGEQKICLSIDAASSANASILTTGNWTSPRVKGSTAVIQITIPVETPNAVNFGWDYQLK